MHIAPRGNAEPSSGAVIVLTYAFSGSEYLREILSPATNFSNTYSTGILPLSDAVAATWRRIDGSGEALSALATKSISSLTSQMIAVIMAETGGARWCETVIAPPDCAYLFTRLYPATKVICFHRSFSEFVRVAVREYPWGIADSPFSAFTAAYPNRSAAAISAYWASYSERLIEFERTHSGSCLRVKYEDLISEAPKEIKRILSFLEVSSEETAVLISPPPEPEPSDGISLAQIPVNEIPPVLRERIKGLCGMLGYPSTI